MRKIRIYSLIVVLTIMSTSFSIYAQDYKNQYDTYADKLSKIGVFKGTGNGYELERQPTRLEGLVMLLRLLGKADDALAVGEDQVSYFTDVPEWGVPYTNYAYEQGLTNGIGNQQFGSQQNIDAMSFHTFLLRALGYDDSIGDFSWSEANEFALEKGIISPYYYGDITNNVFRRDHVAKSAYDCLYSTKKGSSILLIDELISSGDIDVQLANELTNKDILEVHFLDVGQALCILIQDQDGNELVYDAGNNADADFIVNYLNSEGVEDIEYLVNSHPHEDHIGAMDSVLESFVVDNVIMSNKTYDTKAYMDVIELLVKKDIAISDPIAGQKYVLGDWSFEVIGPIQTNYVEVNDYSVVLKVTYGNQSIVLTGDAEALSEQEIIASGVDLKANILQVGHHGSATSSTASFVYKVDPKYAVISVGADNSYGHPDSIVTKRLDIMDIETYWTEVEGTIVFTLDGASIDVHMDATVGNPDSNSTDHPEEPEEDKITVPVVTTPEGSGVVITKLDKVAEYVIIKNNGTVAIDIGGWTMISEKGNQTFVFPSGYILNPGQECILTSGELSGTEDFTMANGTIWNNSSLDPAVLVDKIGNEVDRLEK